VNNRYDIDELLARISSEDRITCLYLASALKKELGLSGYGLFQEFCEKADNYQETWVAADWKSADKQEVTIGPLYHFTNRLNDVDHCSQRGGLASIALAPQALLLSLLVREKFEIATGVLRGPATVVHTLGGTGLLPKLAASSSRAANPLVTLLA
jgi:hypothetical protein